MKIITTKTTAECSIICVSACQTGDILKRVLWMWHTAIHHLSVWCHALNPGTSYVSLCGLVCESLARISGKATVVKLGNWPITRIPRHNASVIIGGKNLEWNLGNRNHLLWSPKIAKICEAQMDYMHPRIALTVSWFVHQSCSIPFVPCFAYNKDFSVD